jgi:hypothetical protein
MRSAKLLGIYLLGIGVLGGWALGHVFEGTVTKDNFALVVVLPLAWIFSYWPMVGSLLMAWKMYRFQGVLERWATRSQAGLQTHEEEKEIEDTFVLALMDENPIPERWARPLVRRALAAAKRKAGKADERTTSAA